MPEINADDKAVADIFAKTDVPLVERRAGHIFEVGTVYVLTDNGEPLGNAVNLDQKLCLVAPCIDYNGRLAIDVTFWEPERRKLAINKTFDLTTKAKRLTLPERQPFSSADDTVSQPAPTDGIPVSDGTANITAKNGEFSEESRPEMINEGATMPNDISKV